MEKALAKRCGFDMFLINKPMYYCLKN